MSEGEVSQERVRKRLGSHAPKSAYQEIKDRLPGPRESQAPSSLRLKLPTPTRPGQSENRVSLNKQLIGRFGDGDQALDVEASLARRGLLPRIRAGEISLDEALEQLDEP
jgi:hypothetical protein